jgi:hypothetical protein
LRSPLIELEQKVEELKRHLRVRSRFPFGRGLKRRIVLGPFISDRKFDIYGCAAHCLMTIANARRAGLTKATFIDRYASRYWIGSYKGGGLIRDQVKEVAIDLGLARIKGFLESRRRASGTNPWHRSW